MEIPNNETFLQKASKKVKRFFAWTLVIISVLLVLFILFIFFGSYSKGIRSGKIIKISERGFLFKTWEGQLDIGSFGAIKNSDNQFTQTFDFSVRNDAIAKQLEDAAFNGNRVSLHYVEKYIKIPWLGETKYFIEKVENAGEPKKDNNLIN